ncbi:MAG: AraC family transcriptional regulator [Anaerolineae bacterium]|nr:AraC family transcriptional regulator [Anaerolineae bacterium]
MPPPDLSCEERRSDSSFVQTVWRSSNEQPTPLPFISMAQSHWGMVITKCDGETTITIRGPETKATPAFSPAYAEFMGILFKPGVLMPDFPAAKLMDRADVTLPQSSRGTFRLNGDLWQFPDYENVDTFVAWLARDGLLIHDPLVADVLNGKPIETSLRTVQRRFLQATGLTHGKIDQINRARHATSLLKQGVSPLDAVHQVGYSDQPHLIRSLKCFIGLTPNQIRAENRQQSLSFLFNT